MKHDRRARNVKMELERIASLHASGQVDTAIVELQRLVKEEPQSRAARVRLANWLADVGRKDEAISALYKLQEVLAAQKDMLAAISAGLKIVELDPTFDNPLSFVAKVNSDRFREQQEVTSVASDPPPEAPAPADVPPSLANIPLLSELAPEELAEVALGMKRRLLSEGAVLFEQGDASRTLCFVVSGALAIRDGSKQLDRATAGQCLGEFAFLTGEARSATIVATGDCEVLELTFESMQPVSTQHPHVIEVLNNMYQGRVLARVLASSPLFEFMSAGERHRIAAKFEQLRAQRGQAIFQEGAEDGALYLVKTGSVQIQALSSSSEQAAPQTVALGRIGPNEFFGEVSFLTGVPRTATVVACEESELLRIHREDLQELTAEYPQLEDVLKQFHVDRALERAKASSA